MKLDLIKKLCGLSKKQLQIMIVKYLKSNGYKKIISNNMYVLAEGELPVCLCAHMDTVFLKPPTTFYYDQAKSVLWSPQGLGADDRAGIYAIISLIESGYHPSIILTDMEERGGLGAEALIKKYPDCPFEDCRALIQLDRQGEKDAVYYDCDNKAFEKAITAYGFKTELGTFSDISIIAPQWKIAAVNLSVGYFDEHKTIETLNMSNLLKTIKKLRIMLKECKNWPSYAYIPFDYSKYLFNNVCIFCNKVIPEEADYHYCYASNDFKTQFKICDQCYNMYYNTNL